MDRITIVICAAGALLLGGAARADLKAPAAREGLVARCRVALAKYGNPKAKVRDVADGAEAFVEARGREYVTARCAGGTMPVPQGTLALPAGWIYVDVQGIDSRPGHLLDERSVERLHYDIGAMAGTMVTGRSSESYDWLREESIAGTTLRYAQRKGRFEFTLEPFTNFYGDARELDVLLGLFRSLRAKPEK
jgi:hypothetical protein